MRIGLVIEGLDPQRGGVEQWTAQFARGLTAAGHELHVVARDVAPQVESCGLVAHRVAVEGGRLRFAAAAEQVLRALDLDLVHDTGCGWYCDVLQPHGGSRLASFEQNLRLSPHWLRPLRRLAALWLPRRREFARLAERQFADPRRLVIAISKMVARDLVRHYNLGPEQLRLVYNGVDLERFSPRHKAAHRQRVRDQLRVGDDELLLLIVAHNFRLKGVPTLVRAARRLAAQGYAVKVAVVGGKRPRRPLTARLSSAEPAAFLGPVDDPVPLYAAADVYVQPTFYDPCSLVVLEALASGLPVVTSRFNGAAELMSAGVEGFILDDPADDAELAAALRPLFDARLRHRQGAAARALACQHSLERNCREVLAVYDEVHVRRQRVAA